jgi:hypothetical protein
MRNKITVKNLTIQFDTYDAGADIHNAYDMLDEINKVLQERFSDASPIIFVNGRYDIDIKPDRETMIEDIIGSMGDRPENDGKNTAWLEGLSDDELMEQWKKWTTT